MNQKYLQYQNLIQEGKTKDASILRREINSTSLEDVSTIENISEFNLYVLINKYITMAIIEEGKNNIYTERLHFTINMLLDKVEMMIETRKEQIKHYYEAREEVSLLKETLSTNESPLSEEDKQQVLDQFIASDKFSNIKYELTYTTMNQDQEIEMLEINNKQEWFKEWNSFANNFGEYDLHYLKIASRNHPTMSNYRLPLIKPATNKTKRYVGENSNELWLDSYLLKNDKTINIQNNSKIKKIRIS